MVLRFSLLILIFLLSGCETQWVNLSSEEIFSTAKNFCHNQAKNKFPIKNEIVQRTKYLPSYTHCSRKKHCHYRADRVEIESYVMDVNDDSRRREFHECMGQRGWQEEIKWGL